jgi:hypothetical protein
MCTPRASAAADARVTARVDEHRAAAVEEIMGRRRSVDPDTRGRVYRDGGWRAFDEGAAAELERERTRDLIPIA